MVREHGSRQGRGPETMIHWDREARRRRLSARLKALDDAHLVAFVAATLEQALTLAAPGRSACRTLVREAIATARAPKRPTAQAVATLAARIGDAEPDEDDRPPKGHADLLSGAAALCSLLKRPKPAAASSAASYAYQAVLGRFIDSRAAAGGEASFERAERATPEAMAFLEEQYARLTELEAAPANAPFAVWKQDGARAELDEADALRRVSALVRVKATAVDVVLSRGDCITLLLAPQRGFLLHMQQAGDVGRVAARPSGEDRQWSFRLANGQVDDYPDAMTLPRDKAIAVLEALISGARMPSTIVWVR